MNPKVQDIQSLLSDCISKTVPVESCQERSMKLLLDPEGILPPIQYVGGRIIEMFDRDPKISISEIISLCRQPARFFILYSQIVDKRGMPEFPENIVQKMSTLLRGERGN